MKKAVAAIAIIGVVVLSIAAAFWAGPGSRSSSKRAKGGQIGLVRVEGTITAGEGGMSLLGGGSVGAETIVKQLDAVAKDPTIKAVVLRVNSPGGSAVASWEMGEAIKRVKEAGKPVVVSMGDSAASGGYWISTFADKIVASPGTMTGSIGVIMQTANLTEIYDKIGYRTEVIKSGPYKDIGSPAREMTEAERQMLQDMMMQTYEQFVQVVAEGRKMSPDKVRAYADGRILTGKQALNLGLVDELGDLHRAVRLAAEMAELPGEPTVKEIGGSTSPLGALLGGKADSSVLKEVLTRLFLERGADAQGNLPSPQALQPELGTVR